MFLSAAPGRSPTDDFWYAPAARASNGALVTSDTALRLSTVYKCVRAIAETIGALPMPVYRRLQRGKERDAAHPLSRLLQQQPNPWQTALQWREMMQGHASLTGNGFSEIVYTPDGRPDMLLPLHPQRTRVEVAPSGLPRYRTTDASGRERTLVFGQVIHLAGFSTDGLCGLNPIEAEREAIGAAITSRDFGSAYFANAARPPVYIKMPAGMKFASDEARREFVRNFSASYAGARQGTAPVMDQGMELVALPLSNSDSQWIESRKYSDVDICGLWRVPPHKVGIFDQAKWANVEQAALEWVTDCLLPWARRWEQTLLRDLDFGPDHFPELLLDGLLRGDTTTRFAAYGKGIQDGWMTRNEARERENLNALDGLDDPLQPLNMAPAGSRGADQARGSNPDASLPPSDPAPQTEATPAPAAQDQRAFAILQASAERVARKELALIKRCSNAAEEDMDFVLREAFAGHANFVAEVMAVSPSCAAEHVATTVRRAAYWLKPGTHSVLADNALAIQTAALMRLET